MAIGGSAWLKARISPDDGARAFTPRILAYAFGIELPYSLLVPVAHLRLLNVVDPELQTRALALAGLTYVVKSVILVALLARMLQPIERLRRYGAGGRPSSPADAERRSRRGALPARLILDAARAAYNTPLAFAAVWALAWALIHVPVTVALPRVAPAAGELGAQRALAMGLFSLACFAAALPLAYSIIGRLLSPVAGVISILARERNLTIPGKGYSLADRLVLLGVCLAIAPTSWMAAMVLAGAAGPTVPGSTVTLAIFSLVAVAWAPVCASFIAGALASPFLQVGAVIEKIVQRGDVERLQRIPVHFKDEVGELAGGVNAMVDRLEESSRRMRAYLAERERLLQDAAQRAAQLQAVLDNLVEGVFACDAQGRVTMINASGVRLLGLMGLDERTSGGAPGCERGAGRPVEEVLDLARIHHPDGRPFTRDELPLVRALAGETIAQEKEIRARGPGDRMAFLRTSAAPIRGPDGAVIGAVAVACDVTELVELDLVKDQFVRVGAHELKTPLAIMKGYSLALLRHAADLSPRRRRMLEAIDRGANRMNRVVDDLLATSQASMDVIAMSVQEVDLGRIVQEAVERVGESAPRHHFAIKVPPDRPLIAQADPERLRQTLAIVLDNAVKYSPAGGAIDVTLAVAERPAVWGRAADPPRGATPEDSGEWGCGLAAHGGAADESSGVWGRTTAPPPAEVVSVDSGVWGRSPVRPEGAAAPPPEAPVRADAALFAMGGGPGLEAVISVRDRGVGIPAHKQGRIFERFFRAHTDTVHDYGGIGLGLFLARDMIARQGGRIWFESDERRGTTFHFTVPLGGRRGSRG